MSTSKQIDYIESLAYKLSGLNSKYAEDVAGRDHMNLNNAGVDEVLASLKGQIAANEEAGRAIGDTVTVRYTWKDGAVTTVTGVISRYSKWADGKPASVRLYRIDSESAARAGDMAMNLNLARTEWDAR